MFVAVRFMCDVDDANSLAHILSGAMPVITGEKQVNGRFETGQSGNPAGRPKGTRSRATILAEKLMLADEEEIVASLYRPLRAAI